MEFFPPNEFNRDWETVVRSMGIRYVAWQGNQCVLVYIFVHPMSAHRVSDLNYRKYTGEDLPAFSQSTSYDDFALDAQAVVGAITDGLNTN